MRWFLAHCPSCGLASGVQREITETIRYRCPGCDHTIVSGPPLPDPLEPTRQLLLRSFVAPAVERQPPIDQAATTLANAFDGVVVDLDDSPPPGPVQVPLERRSLAQWIRAGIKVDAAPATIAAIYRKLFDRLPHRQGQTRIYSREELLAILEAARSR